MGYEGKQLSVKEEDLSKPNKVVLVECEENEAEIQYFHNDLLFDSGNTYTDYYGEMTCIDGAKEDAEKDCRRYKIDERSSLELRIILKRKIVEKTYKITKLAYEKLLGGEIPRGYLSVRSYLQSMMHGYPRELSKKETTVWSSKKDLK